MTRQGFATELEDIVFQGDLLRQFVGNAPSPLSTESATELKDFRHAWRSVSPLSSGLDIVRKRPPHSMAEAFDAQVIVEIIIHFRFDGLRNAPAG